MTVSAIIDLSLLFINALYLMYLFIKSIVLKNENKELAARIEGFLAAQADCDAYYFVRRIQSVEEHEHNGRWAVCRTSTIRNCIYNTCIKVFTDEDDDFNKLEAEELCEILNSK